MTANLRYLARNEVLVLEVRRHVTVLLSPFLVAAGAVAFASFVGVITSPRNGAQVIDTLVGFIAVVMVARFAWRVWEWWVDRVIVTDQRILEASGVLTRKVASMPLEKVTDMTYQRSIGGRLLGYGDFIVESAGQDQGLSRIDRVPQPDDFYRTVTGLVTGSGAPTEHGSRILFDGRGRGGDDEDTGPLPRVFV